MSDKNIKKEEKLKPFACVHPTTKNGKIVAFLYLVVILCGIVPIISLVNKPIFVFGMPLLMCWSIAVVLMVVIVLQIAQKLGVK